MGKAREYYLTNRVARIEWRLDQVQRCMLCEWHEGQVSDHMRWLEVHEIERRSHAPTRWAHPCNYLLVCNMCHMDMIPLMDHAQQLAVKWQKDPVCFDLDAWLRLRDPDLKAPMRVTAEDVEAHL